MEPVSETARISKGALWTGRIISAWAALMFTFDGVSHLMKPVPVVEAFAQLGYPLSASVGIGVVLLICTAIYVTPRTSILGAILLTGYLGGAVSTHVRAGSPLFETVFPVIFGGLVWLGVYLRDTDLRALIPLRNS
jgi:DoxX-like family